MLILTNNSHNQKIKSNREVKKKVYLTEAEEIEIEIERKRQKTLSLLNQYCLSKPYMQEVIKAISNKEPQKLSAIVVQYGLDFGFINQNQEEFLSNNPERISKLITNKYLGSFEDCSARLRSKFKPLKLNQVMSKKDIEHHNYVEEVIAILNPGYEPKLIIE